MNWQRVGGIALDVLAWLVWGPIIVPLAVVVFVVAIPFELLGRLLPEGDLDRSGL